MSNSIIKADPHPTVITDASGNTLDTVTSAPVAGDRGLVVYTMSSSAVDQVQTASEGPTGSAVPADASLNGLQDASGNLQPAKLNYVLNATNQISVANTPTLIITSNNTRAGVLITNPSTTVTVYVGGSGVTTANGQILAPGNSITLPVSSAVYGIVTTGTQTVSYVELV
jgi:hypothetical protein